MDARPVKLHVHSVSTSILLCSHNHGRYLNAAIHSALRQTTSDFELLVVNDGSTDETEDLLPFWKSHPRVRLFSFVRPQGLSACRNAMLAEARGEFLSILDADDCLTRDKVASHAGVLINNRKVGVVWGKTLLLTAKNQEAYEAAIRPKPDFVPGWDITTPYEISHSATTWRIRDLRRAGGYDPGRVLVEAPDLYLKLGDFTGQFYLPRVACLKRVLVDGVFRSQLDPEKKRTLSKLIHAETLQRRFGFRQLENEKR